MNDQVRIRRSGLQAGEEGMYVGAPELEGLEPLLWYPVRLGGLMLVMLIGRKSSPVVETSRYQSSTTLH